LDDNQIEGIALNGGTTASDVAEEVKRYEDQPEQRECEEETWVLYESKLRNESEESANEVTGIPKQEGKWNE